MQKLRETMTDTLLSTYYYLDLGIIKILVLIFDILPYVFICTPPPTPTHQHPEGLQAIWDSGLGTIRRKRNFQRIHPMNCL